MNTQPNPPVSQEPQGFLAHILELLRSAGYTPRVGTLYEEGQIETLIVLRQEPPRAR